MGTEDAYELLMKGRHLLLADHPHQAAVVLERAAILEPKKASIREDLARALFRSGQPRRAKEEFERVIEKEPTNHYAHYGLGLCLARIGSIAKARGHLKLAVASRPNNEVYSGALRSVREDH